MVIDCTFFFSYMGQLQIIDGILVPSLAHFNGYGNIDHGYYRLDSPHEPG
jgi:hypothetical protein